MPELQLNTALRTAIADATGALFGAGAFQIRSGTRPGANAAASGTLLVEVDPLSDPAFGTAASGAVAKAGTWEATVAVTGAPGHFRLISSDGTLIREGDAGATGAGTSLEITGLEAGDLIEGGVLTVGSYTITQSEGSATP